MRDGVARRRMSWVTIIWSMSAAVSLTLGAIHFVVWLQDRKAWANLWFALLAASVAGFAGFELAVLQAQTAAQYATLHQWGHVPLFFTFVSLIGFIMFYFRSGRAWLAWTVIGLRLVVLLINFTFGPTFNFRAVTGILPFQFLGETVAVPVVVPSPWARLGEGSALLLLVFVLDASIRLWRRGDANERRRALVVGGGIALFISLSVVNGLLIHSGTVHAPHFVSLFFVLIVVAMGYELSRDVIHAGRMAEELRENAEGMSLAAGAAQLALWRWDIARDVIWVSPNGRQLYGIPPGEVISLQRFLDTLHPDDREPARQAVMRSLEGDGAFHSEYRVVLPDGAVRWIGARGKVEFNGQREPLCLRGVSGDITERKRIESEVAEQLRFEILLADLSARFVNVPAEQLDDQIEEAQRLVCECLHVDLASLFQWSVEDPSFTRTHFWRLSEGPPLPMKIDAGEHLPWARQQLQAGKTVVFSSLDELPPEAARDKEHFRYLGIKSGVGIPLSAGGAPLVGGLTFNAIREERVWPEEIVKRLRLVAEVFANALARKRSEQEAAQHRAELAHLTRVNTLSELSGSLAHELNQPLGIILSNAQAAQDIVAQMPEGAAELGEILADIVAADRRAGEVIQRLRTLLKRGESEMLPLSLNGVIEEVLHLAHADLIGRGVTVVRALAPDLPQATGDEVQLQQVVLNLVLNAADAMSANPPDARRIHIATTRDEGVVRASIRDEGGGLPADPEKLFEPFYTTKPHGLGMGLAICRSIITAHAGRLWAEPHPDHGAVFHFELPIAGPTEKL